MPSIEQFNTLLTQQYAAEDQVDILSHAESYETSMGVYYAAFYPEFNICFIEAQPNTNPGSRRVNRAEEMRDLQEMVLTDHPGAALFINVDSLGVKVLDLDRHAMNELSKLTHEAEAVYALAQTDSIIMKFAYSLFIAILKKNIYTFTGEDALSSALTHLRESRLGSRADSR